jgi:hypothetical protein
LIGTDFASCKKTGDNMKYEKYEKPQLIEIGGAHEVILGVVTNGYDLDTHLIMSGEFADDLPAD